MPGSSHPVTLAPVDREQLPGTFREAFADYAVDVSQMTAEQLQARLTKNNVNLGLSPGAYAEGRLVAFTLIGVDERNGEGLAYDAATGVIPAYRGRELARKMFEESLPALRARGVTRFLLEVLQVNEAAIRAYERVGFRKIREFRCFELDVQRASTLAPISQGVAIRPVDRDAVLSFRPHVDWQPSWENDFPAIERLPESPLAFGAFDGDDCIGAVAYSPLFNGILLLAVRKPWRRRGVGTALVGTLARSLPPGVEAMKLNNVDASDRGIQAFLKRSGFRNSVDQYEMSLSIVD